MLTGFGVSFAKWSPNKNVLTKVSGLKPSQSPILTYIVVIYPPFTENFSGDLLFILSVEEKLGFCNDPPPPLHFLSEGGT